ncbi:MAG: peptidase inhibitor family I36 protein [Leucobacter sp.]
MQERVEDVIEEHGGTQTGWNEVTWDEGAVVLTIAPEDSNETSANSVRTAAKDNCAAGKYCAYGKIGYGGNKLTYTACPATYTSFSAIGSVRSIKNNRTSGTVKAYNGSTLKNTLSPGNGSSNTSGITKITCA